MKRLLGFALFFFTMGILFCHLVTSQGWQFGCGCTCLILSYILFFRC